MANITANPFSFVNGDIKTGTISAMAQVANQPINDNNLFTCTSTTHGLVAGNFCTVVGVTPAGYNGGYRVMSAPSTTTLVLLKLATNIPTLAAWSSGGTTYLSQYPFELRAEDMSWLNAATIADTCIVYDLNGNLVWSAIAPTKGNYSRSKPFWIKGVTVAALDSGTLTITVN